jgi:glucokinase
MYAIGIDIGGTTVKLGVVRDGLEIIYRDRRRSPRDPQEMAAAIHSMVRVAKKRFPDSRIGISCAGSLDSSGHVTANQLGWVAAPLGPLLYELFQQPIPMENDAMCALAAEHFHGALKGYETGLLITLGTGIGGGIIIGGMPVRGHNGLHGEIGHMITHAGGRQCSCGQQGCWEMYAAASALRKMAGGLSVRETISLIRAGELQEVWQEYVHEVCVGMCSLMMIFAPDVIAIGGGLSNAGDIVVDNIRQCVQNTSAYQVFNPFTQIVTARFQNDAGILGAAALASMV